MIVEIGFCLLVASGLAVVASEAASGAVATLAVGLRSLLGTSADLSRGLEGVRERDREREREEPEDVLRRLRWLDDPPRFTPPLPSPLRPLLRPLPGLPRGPFKRPVLSSLDRGLLLLVRLRLRLRLLL